MLFDTEGKGLGSVFKPWELKIIEILSHMDEPVGSHYVHQELLHDNVTISRASVINFLKRITDDGLLDSKDITGKGGHHPIYKLKPIDLKKHYAKLILEAVAIQLASTPPTPKTDTRDYNPRRTKWEKEHPQ